MNISTFLMFAQIQSNKGFKYCDAIIDEAVCLFQSPWWLDGCVGGWWLRDFLRAAAGISLICINYVWLFVSKYQWKSIKEKERYML